MFKFKSVDTELSLQPVPLSLDLIGYVREKDDKYKGERCFFVGNSGLYLLSPSDPDLHAEFHFTPESRTKADPVMRSQDTLIFLSALNSLRDLEGVESNDLLDRPAFGYANRTFSNFLKKLCQPDINITVEEILYGIETSKISRLKRSIAPHSDYLCTLPSLRAVTSNTRILKLAEYAKSKVSKLELLVMEPLVLQKQYLSSLGFVESPLLNFL